MQPFRRWDGLRLNLEQMGENAMLNAKLAVAMAVVGAVAGTVNAAAFTPGNVAVYRVDGSGVALSNTGSAVFVDEYTPTGVLVQSIAMPSVSASSAPALIASGTATSEGFLSRSADGLSLVLAGYNRSLGGAGNVSGTASATVGRSVARLTAAGVTSISSFEVYSGGTIRGVASTDGDRIWTTGSTGGVFTGTLSGGSLTNIGLVSGVTNVTNTRTIQIVNSQLLISLAQGSLSRVGVVAEGLPAAGPSTFAGLPGTPTAGSTYGTLLLDRDATVAGVDTLYIVDDSASTGGLFKFSFDGTTWTARGSSVLTGTRGLTGGVSGDNAALFITNGGSLQSFVDTAAFNQNLAGSFASLASAPSFAQFRGIALAPIPEPAALGLLAPAALVLARRRK